MAREIRVAVCDAGVRSRQAILPALHGLENVKIVGLCDIAKELAPDEVLSIGNLYQLYDSWIWMLEKGIPLAIEKPLDLSAHQSSSLAYMARRHNVSTQVLFQRRYTPVAQRALAMCRARRLPPLLLGFMVCHVNRPCSTGQEGPVIWRLQFGARPSKTGRRYPWQSQALSIA